MLHRALFIAALTIVLPSVALAAPDMSISANDIRFSETTLVSGEYLRIYATVKNIGDADIAAYVLFYQGNVPIGQSQVVSTKAGGENDEVWVDFTIPYGSFNIRAEIKGSNPQDLNISNDVAISKLFTPIVDDDGDGVADEQDNCPSESNADQLDTDNDGAGNACDTDDDNDSLTDDEELSLGTDPLDVDSDGDGVSDGSDYDPTDPSVTVKPEPIVAGEHDEVVLDDQETESEPEPEPEPELISEEDIVVEDLPETDGEVVEGEVEDFSRDELIAEGLLPDSSFVYVQNKWKDYSFRAITADEGVSFFWDFGDGVTSAQRAPDHVFKSHGNYDVTLTATYAAGHNTLETEQVMISFFHTGNPMIKIIIAVLGLLILVFLSLIFKKGKPSSAVSVKTMRPASAKKVMVSTPPGRAPVMSKEIKTLSTPPGPPKTTMQMAPTAAKSTGASAAAVLQRAVAPVKSAVDTGKTVLISSKPVTEEPAKPAAPAKKPTVKKPAKGRSGSAGKPVTKKKPATKKKVVKKPARGRSGSAGKPAAKKPVKKRVVKKK
jgi:PKD repeat protein